MLLLVVAVGCQFPEDDTTHDRPVVEVVASDSSLQSRSTVPSGWVTFRMENEGTAHHSFKLRKLPKGQEFEEYRRGLFVPADSLEEALVEGKIDTATYQKEMRKHVPEWFGQVNTVGGITGLAPGETARITHKLGTGHYVLSCLFRTPENRTHALLGVRAGLHVTEDSSEAAPPEADVTAQISSGGLNVEAGALSDEQIVAFRSVKGPQGTHSPWAGLFRLSGETDADAVVSWMSRGIPLPAPTAWIGGPEPLPVGDVAYVHVGDLSPGRYAWVTEAARDTSGMIRTFAVESQ